MTKKRRPADNRHKKGGRKLQSPSTSAGRIALPEWLVRPRRFWLIASIIVLMAAFFSVGFYRAEGGPGYPLDDTWIHLAFAQNVASGSGFGANPHEPTPGATSPLWVLLLAPGFIFGAVHATWPWILATLVLGAAGVLCGALGLALVRATVKDTPPWAVWAAVLCGITVVWTAPLVWSTAGAMEVSLFVAMICATLLTFTARSTQNWRSGLSWGALAGAAALSRPEGLLLAPILALISLWPLKRGTLVEAASGLAACALVYSPSVVFCLATSGNIFPNTFYAKTTALVAGAPSLRYLHGVVMMVRGISPVSLWAFVIGIAGVVIAVWRRSNVRGVVATAAFVVGLPLAYAAMGRTYLFAPFAGNFGRYLYPILPAALALGFWAVTYAVVTYKHRLVGIVVLVLIVIAPVLSIFGTIERVDLYRHNVRDINTLQVEMARSLQQKLAPGDLVAANDVGALAYFTEFRVLDLIGIVSTKTLHALEPAAMEPNALARAHYSLLLQEKPAALVVFPQWFQGALDGLGPIAKPIATITNPSNITSPYPRLIAYRLDWPRR